MTEYAWQAKILDAYPESGKWKIKLDKSHYYPGGGGQPSDTGHIKAPKFSCKVTHIEEQKDGTQLLHCDAENGLPEPETTVEATIDADRREMFTKLHTAEHILFRSIQNVVESRKEELTLKKMELHEHEGIIFANTHELNWDDLITAERTANHLIHENLQITEHVIGKTDVHKYPLLRIKADRIPGDKIRVIKIGEYDISACKGTHCKNTNEIAGILITQFNQAGKGNYEIRFTADLNDPNTQEKMFALATAGRKSAAAAGTSIEQSSTTIQNLKEENNKLKQQIKEILKTGTGIKFEEQKIGNITLKTAIVEGLDHKQTSTLATKALNENTIILVINQNEDKNQISLYSKSKHDAAQTLQQITEHLGGKSGGKKEFASGSIPKEATKDAIKMLEAMIRP